jgi:hypothetical protein
MNVITTANKGFIMSVFEFIHHYWSAIIVTIIGALANVSSRWQASKNSSASRHTWGDALTGMIISVFTAILFGLAATQLGAITTVQVSGAAGVGAYFGVARLNSLFDGLLEFMLTRGK